MTTQAEALAATTAAIKRDILASPGILLDCKRQVGKTTAILELIHDQHQGRAAYGTFRSDLALMARGTYFRRWPQGESPLFTSDPEKLRGWLLPIYVDEWWLMSEQQQDKLSAIDFGGLVRARVGTFLAVGRLVR